MDCEKFDQHVMDALYDELDELTYAAMKRHMEGCARCASAFAGLRATRDVGVLPLEEPSEELEARILEAVAVAQKKTPFRRKALRALAWAGSHAMRPQLAMAALFVLVIGSSLLLLRAKPGTVGVAPVRVTERGVPAPDQPEPAQVLAAAAPPPPTAAPAAESRRASADEPLKKDKDDAEGGATAALKEAQSLQKKSGCAAALGKLDEVGTQYPGTPAAHTAMWDAARCYKSEGDEEKAKELFLSLRAVSGYHDRADRELAALEARSAAKPAQNASPSAAGGGPGRNAAAAPARAAATPAPMADEGNADLAAPQAPADRAAPAPAQAQEAQ
jgi:hypothetical protein